MKRKTFSLRRGLSLLEVMLALAILGTTLAVIGELSSIGARAAARARDISTAQIHCDSVMAQVVTGLIPPTAAMDVAIDDPNAPGEWLYSIMVEQVDQKGLLAVKVTVSQSPEFFTRPVSFSLGRWMLDPTVTGTSSTASQSTTSSTTSSSTTTSQ